NINLSTGVVREYDLSGNLINPSLITGLLDPLGIAVSGNDLYVTSFAGGNPGQGVIGRYTSSGATVNASLVTGLSGPAGIATLGSNIFVASGTTGAVYEFANSGGTVDQPLIPGTGSGGGGLAVVPEPSSFILATIGAALLAGLRKRQQTA